jgi:tetratricopeptide (TPR) repeat protein
MPAKPANNKESSSRPLFQLGFCALMLGLLMINLRQVTDVFKLQAFSSRGLPEDTLTLAVRAAEAGDYNLAQELYQSVSNKSNVLGLSTTVERLIYPKQAIATEIGRLELESRVAPSRLRLLELALLYWRLDDINQAWDYLKQAQRLDPNDPSILSVMKILQN